MNSARTRELLGLIPVSLLVTAGFTAVVLTRTGADDINNATVIYGAVFLGLCVFAHLFIRARLPDADPYMFPLAALLASFGLVMIYRIDPELAREQAQWFVFGLICFCGTIVLLRDHHALERYRYTIAAVGIGLLVLPRVPGIGAQVNGAYLAIRLGPVQFQPAEFAKLAIIVFLASYLRDTGDVLLRARLTPLPAVRVALMYAGAVLAVLLVVALLHVGTAGTVLLGVFAASAVAVLRERPSLKHFGPLLLVWGAAMLMLIFIRDLGSSLMFFGGFLALLYVATNRLSLVGVGSTMFLAGAIYTASHVSHVKERVDVWLDPFAPKVVDKEGFQIAQSLFAQADGGLFGQGFGRALLDLPNGNTILPAADTDLIYAVIADELGLFGAVGLILVYLLFAARGFKAATTAGDTFSKLLATGLTAVLTLQVFVIVGGVTKLIPLTGVTLPFVSYGGSSIVANLVLLALLLIVSDHARRDRPSSPGGPGVNRAITQLFGLTILLFALLVAFTSRWTVFDAQSLKDEPANRRALIEEQQIPRGRILADDGTLLARSVGRGSGPRRVFVRRYPADNLFSHAIGYSFIGNGRVGLERSRNAPLTGDKNEFASVFDEFRNRQREGEDLRTNLDPKGQRTALQALSGRRGSVVAIEPQTGKVRVMASVPAYDPNQIPERQSQLNRADGSPLLNRATQTRYQPGSTFKVVTAAAALDSGRYTPTTSVDGSSPRTVSGVPLSNSGGENFGTISLTEALTNSVNTVWAQVGESIGRRTLEKYMGRFGFNQDPPLDYPDSQMAPSGIRNSKSRLLTGNDGFDVGRVAIGQGGQEGQIQVSPLQMAMVAAAVGNGGKLMKPRLTDRVVAQDGRVTKRINPQQQSRVMSGKSAGELGQMMASVVKEGTGTAAALNGIDVAGKTGTAEVENGQRNQVWFIAFAPVKNPRMAIAVTLESQPKGSQGGTVAAPVAKQVLQELLR